MSISYKTSTMIFCFVYMFLGTLNASEGTVYLAENWITLNTMMVVAFIQVFLLAQIVQGTLISILKTFVRPNVRFQLVFFPMGLPTPLLGVAFLHLVKV